MVYFAVALSPIKGYSVWNHTSRSAFLQLSPSSADNGLKPLTSFMPPAPSAPCQRMQALRVFNNFSVLNLLKPYSCISNIFTFCFMNTTLKSRLLPLFLGLQRFGKEGM